MAEKIFYIAAGSVAGGLSRFFIASWGNRFSFGNFPYGTFLVNITGCFAAGFIAALAVDKIPMGENGKLLLLTGFCGAFTTFSAWIMETENLVSGGFAGAAFFNIALSLFAGYLLFCGGFLLAKIL